jgi:hypothetical protein
MRQPTSVPRPVARPITLGGLAIAALVLPDGAYSVVADSPAEVLIVRLLLLVGVSLLAVTPWLSEADDEVRRRLRRWTIPGVGASAVYFISTETLYLIVGFCLLVGATLDVWATRAHIASGKPAYPSSPRRPRPTDLSRTRPAEQERCGQLMGRTWKDGAVTRSCAGAGWTMGRGRCQAPALESPP